MLKKHILPKITYLLLLAIILFGCKSSRKETDLSKYVNPFIGTSGSKLEGHGNTFPGAAYPFGMVQLSPDNGKSGPYYCSGYFYPEDVIAGFSHTHLSGTDNAINLRFLYS